MILTPFRATHLLPEVGEAEIRLYVPFEAHPNETCWLPSGQVVACYGCVLASPGRGILWAVVTPLAAQHVLGTVRAMRRALHRTIRDYGLWRVELVADATQPRSLRLAQHLGLQREARLEAYGPCAEPFDQYVWINKKERVNDR